MDLNLAKTALEQGITFVRNAGLQVVELRPGYVKCLMPFRNNGNHIGSMYAGALLPSPRFPAARCSCRPLTPRNIFRSSRP